MQEDAKKMKSKQRSKMQPKMGKLGMDYQMMHEAFFKYQSKPRMSRVGDLYYEGKEFEARVSHLYLHSMLAVQGHSQSMAIGCQL